MSKLAHSSDDFTMAKIEALGRKLDEAVADDPEAAGIISRGGFLSNGAKPGSLYSTTNFPGQVLASADGSVVSTPRRKPRLTWKIVRNKSGRAFIYRVAWNLADGGSWKLHLIVRDDEDGFHTHPWSFTSLVLFSGYHESTSQQVDIDEWDGYERLVSTFRRNRRHCKDHHRTRLRRTWWGWKVPALTIGRYGPKVQLCSHCVGLGHCKDAYDVVYPERVGNYTQEGGS